MIVGLRIVKLTYGDKEQVVNTAEIENVNKQWLMPIEQGTRVYVEITADVFLSSMAEEQEEWYKRNIYNNVEKLINAINSKEFKRNHIHIRILRVQKMNWAAPRKPCFMH